LYVLRVVDEPREWVRAWKPPVDGIQEVFHARFIDHAYPPHTHEAWTVFTVDEGAVAYELETRRRGVVGSTVTILPPHVVHDGRAANGDGYRKRVLYVGTDVLAEHLIGRAVDRPDIRDQHIVRGVRALHRALRDPGDAFEAETIFALVGSRMREHLGILEVHEPPWPHDVAADLRDLLDERSLEMMALAEAGQILQVSPAHLVRCFTKRFGISPHRYVLARRIDAARSRLLEGEPVAQVAAEVGFHDQAHLTRHFKRHVGVTPARYTGRRT
jgi:AraC-like DNA-binding protein